MVLSKRCFYISGKRKQRKTKKFLGWRNTRGEKKVWTGCKHQTGVSSYIYINLFVLRYKTNRTYVFGDCKRLKKQIEFDWIRCTRLYRGSDRRHFERSSFLLLPSILSFLSSSKFVFTRVYIYMYIFVLRIFSKACTRYIDALSIFSSNSSYFYFYLFIYLFTFLFSRVHARTRVCRRKRDARE